MALDNHFRAFLRENYSNFSGRASRCEFNLIISTFIFINLFVLLFGGLILWDWFLSIKFIFYKMYDIFLVLLAFPVSSLIVRRMHDIHLSGFLFPLLYCSFFGVCFYFGLYAYIFYMFLSLPVLLIVLMLVRGTVGSNRFGPDPVIRPSVVDVESEGIKM